jgi:RNA-directed DNA polymerase
MLGMSTSTTAMTTTTIRRVLIMFVVFAQQIMIKIFIMFSFQNIYKAYKACIKHKRNTLNALNFEADLIQNLLTIEDELKSKSYSIGKSICFLARSPKLREVFAADFKDRVVHHILVNQLEPFYEKKFVFDVYNNRKHKGIHGASKRAKSFMNSVGYDGYYLQLDIKGFFYNLDKNILFKQIFNDIDKSDISNKKDILWLANKIIYHDPTKNFVFKGNFYTLKQLPEHKTLFKIPKHKGLPIGNLTSQFFANVYMNKFDHFIKRDLKIKHYLRYVDDFVLFHKDKQKLWDAYQQIDKYLTNKLNLKLRDDFKLKQNNQGLDFLGYIIRPNYMLVRNRVVNNFKYKKAKYLEKYENLKADMSLEEIKQYLSVQASFEGHCSHANSKNLIQKVGKIDEEKYIKLIVTS